MMETKINYELLLDVIFNETVEELVLFNTALKDLNYM